MSPSATLSFIGHSTVRITTESGKTVFIDPWLAGNPSCPESELESKSADFICLTHGHSDHTSSVVGLAKRYGSKVFATYELAMLLIRDGVPEQQVVPMNKGGTVAVPLDNGQSLAVTLTQAFHSSSYDATDGNTYYAGEAAGILLTLESGRNVYHAGDTLLFSDMTLIGRKFKPTLALLPIGDRFTMNPEDAAEAVSMIQPKIVVPVHWGTFPPLTGRPEVFQDLVKKQGTDTDVKVLKPGESFEF